ncbi:MAG: [Fe-Fe] hydrogenase large subunit C-terminal domain-containing protein [Verrucomicrobiota bacterium]
MLKRQPVYTEETECQDCFKCVRSCPVKAIRVESGSAVVMPEECVACGECVSICPVGAKRVRDDLARAQRLLDSGRRVIVSLAPSYLAEFADLTAMKLVRSLRRLGFDSVSETALGAQQVSANVAAHLREHPEPRLYISSACPTAVEMLRKYHPELGRCVTDLLSPMLAHCRMLRQQYGDDIGIVFIGPCVGKKREADRHPELLDAALTFQELRRLFELRGITPHAYSLDAEADRFIPEAAEEGALYPVDGGMIAGIKTNCSVNDAHFMAVSGLQAIPASLTGLDQATLSRPVFVELLACSGGCVNGPLMQSRHGTVAKRLTIIENARYPAEAIPRAPLVDASVHDHDGAVRVPDFSDSQLVDALRQVGKTRPEDELNCGGCGYDNCREFARALLQDKAEPSMCVSYMRKLAQKKANALINTMPSGVVMVDGDGRVVECNEKFAALMGEETLSVYQAKPGLEGALIERVIPFHSLFETVLTTDQALLDHDIRHAGRVLTVSIFSVEPHKLVGGIVQDVTEPAVQKEQVISRARDVIRNNLHTVQQIASLLGENAAESEVVLNSIIESFSPGMDRNQSEPDKIGAAANSRARLRNPVSTDGNDEIREDRNR